ncbi:hypothetical protein [Chryseobacterium oncorhynchi]|uniref:Uncharacterized protein n=1 Tax=Chryseobacterium oncorhynchi TaxID=741074 RepID=A0A316WLJ9_9FLAO|nr:hypothetical protein [Chryseobacterium oncorhynchi]PWN62312.1 hypothetical protein C1638_017625 [Chryseobacterium oncorhynchi]
MDKYKMLAKNIQDIVSADPNLPIDGIVVSIEGDTCTVQLSDGFKVSDVRLKATTDGNDHLLVVPKIGSTVLMISTDTTIDNLTVIKCDQAEKITFNENSLTVKIDSTDGKVQIKNEETSLFDIMQDLSTLLKQLKVYTPSGPSGTPLPDSMTAINEFETKFKKILK